MKNFSDFGIDLHGKSGEPPGEHKVTCPQCSNTRKKKSYPCLNVNTDKGVWHCHHCGWSGGLGTGVLNRSAPPARRVYPRPEFRPAALSEGAQSFFHKRGITTEVLIRNRVALERVYMPQIEDEVTAIAYPYFRAGEIVNVKYRDNNKNFRQVAGAEKIVYKYDDINDDMTIIVEGEMDALALEVAGFRQAISVPDGAPTPESKNLELKFEFLSDERFDRVKQFILAVDSDEPGKKLEDELARRLGRDKCLRVAWPEDCKDANEVLVKHGAQALHHCIEDAKPFPVEGVFSVNDIEEDINNMLEFGMIKGEPTGWDSVNGLYTPAPGQWSLVTGIPSMGKSEWLDAMAINIAENAGWTFGICSPENQPISWHAAKLMEKRMGERLVAGRVNQSKFQEAKSWVNDHFKFIMPEEPSLEAVHAKAKFLIRRHGMKGLIIDPYNELDHTKRKDGVSETEYVSTFLTQLRKFARDNQIHTWLVAHPAKLMKDLKGVYPVPDGYTVSGSAHFYNKADNIIAVHRDVRNPQAPTEVHVQKIRSRWLGKRGTAYLQWQPNSGRFKEFDGAYHPPTGAEYQAAKDGE
jgi:twinkle protein